MPKRRNRTINNIITAPPAPIIIPPSIIFILFTDDNEYADHG